MYSGVAPIADSVEGRSHVAAAVRRREWHTMHIWSNIVRPVVVAATAVASRWAMGPRGGQHRRGREAVEVDVADPLEERDEIVDLLRP